MASRSTLMCLMPLTPTLSPLRGERETSTDKPACVVARDISASTEAREGRLLLEKPQQAREQQHDETYEQMHRTRRRGLRQLAENLVVLPALRQVGRHRRRIQR